MKLDAMLEAVFANIEVGAPGDVHEDRAREVQTSHAIIGQLTLPVPLSVRIRDAEVPGETPIPLRIYTPEGDHLRGALVFAHGGSWRTGSPETANEHTGWLAHDADVVVVSVDYRLVPEHPFPAGLDDVYRALEWTVESAESLGIDVNRIAIGGESAGGNLAAAAAIRARDKGGPAIALQLLEVPVLDLADHHEVVWAEIQAAYPQFTLTPDQLLAPYLTEGVDPKDPAVSPLWVEDAAGLPSLLALAAEVDPVRDDAKRYADKLSAAGVTARSRLFPGLAHGTEGFTALLESAREWQAECVAALKGM